MSLITLTSDMGHRDHYLASIKGFIYKNCPGVTLIDISNEVSPFNVLQAAYFVNNCFPDFPDETIHLILVSSVPRLNLAQPELSQFPCVMRYQKQFFISNDNGIFSLLLKENQPEYIYRIEDAYASPNAMRFPAKNILAKLACQLGNGEKVERLGEKTEMYTKAYAKNPVVDELSIRGSVIHIDHYGNVISNISEDLFKQVGKNAPFTIYFRKEEYHIKTIHSSYSEVPIGEKVAFFNTNKTLEIAINEGTEGNGGGASSLLGLKKDDVIRIEFTPAGSKLTLESLL